MAQDSILWTTNGTGDGGSEYTMDQLIAWLRYWFNDDPTAAGIFQSPNKAGLLNGRLAASGAGSPVAVDPGVAQVYGFPYWSTASENHVISTPVGSTRIDRIVLRADWVLQTVRQYVIAGIEGAGLPAIVQTAGVTWDVPLWQVSITTGGVITLTDDRTFLNFNAYVSVDQLEAAIAGDGLTGADGSPLAVNVGAGLEISSDAVRISAAAAGDGLKGGAGSALDIEPADFAGSGLEDDGSDNLRIAGSAAGDGLTGGGGSPLDVNPGAGLEVVSDAVRIAAAAAGDGLTGGAGSALAVNAGSGLEIVSDAVRIAAAAAGDGLTGGAGSALAVNPDNVTIETSGDQIQVKDDGVNDDKIGARVMPVNRRHGGSSSVWITVGSSNYNPGNLHVEMGAVRVTVTSAAKSGTSATITFHTAFDNLPIVFCQVEPSSAIGGYSVAWAHVAQASGSMTITVNVDVAPGSNKDFDVFWLAMGPEA